MKEKVLIFGAGGHGKVVLEIALSRGDVEILGFLDEDERKIGLEIRGYKVLGSWEYISEVDKTKIALGVGDNKVRYRFFEKIKTLGLELITLIHKGAIVSDDVELGEGVVIMPGVVINPGVTIEDGVVVNTGATVDHDCCLKRFSHIWPGANLAGGVTVGEFSYVGTGAAVIQNIKIGKNSIIGAGAVVIRDIPDNVVVAGVPAKEIRRTE